MISCSNNSLIFQSFILLLLLALPLTTWAQSGNEIFQLQKSSLPESALQYSPSNVGKSWFYTQVDNEAVFIKEIGKAEGTPIAGFNVRSSIVTGFSVAGKDGLIAVSVGDNNTVMPHKLNRNKIYFARQDNRGFAARYFDFQLNSNDYSCTTPYISEDGTKLYFASDMPGGYGGFDLYVCDYRGKEWSTPRNLGPKINTPGHEVYPYMVDNVLFFSSDNHGAKRFDIFTADMHNDKGRLVINPGNPINSDAHDYAMTFDNNSGKGYFLSDRDGVNGKVFEIKNVQKLLLLNIRSNNDRLPIGGAKLDLSRCRKNPMYANAEGSIIMPVSPGEDCFINIERTGYNATSIKLDYDDIAGLKKSIDIYLSEEGVFYTGKAVNENGQPAANVEFHIIDQATGESQLSYTNVHGEYRAALEPLSFYMIRSKSPYFNVKETKISTLASVPKTVLGTISLQSNGILAPEISTQTIQQSRDILPEQIKKMDAPDNPSQPVIQKQPLPKEEPKKSEPTGEPILDQSLQMTPSKSAQEIESASKLTSNPVPESIEKSSGIADKQMEKETPVNTPVAKRFAIQLAAISPDVSDISFYKNKASGFGQVYAVREGNFNKVRLGFFESNEAAKAVRDKLPADLKGGFIVEELNEVRTGGQTVVAMKPSKEMTSGTPKTNITESVQIKETVTPVKVEYKIRLSTLKDPKLFNGSRLKGLGLIEEVKTGDLIVFYLSGFESLEETREVLPKAVNAGFPTAHIVSLSNGSYQKID